MPNLNQMVSDLDFLEFLNLIRCDCITAYELGLIDVYNWMKLIELFYKAKQMYFSSGYLMIVVLGQLINVLHLSTEGKYYRDNRLR